MSWTMLRLKVTTPLFNDSTQGNAGIWVPSLRGAMRFWFRAMAGVGVGPNLDGLAKLESRVFGNTECPSPVMMRVPRQPQVSREKTPTWCNSSAQGKWIGYLMGQGLSTLKKNERTRRFECLLNRPYVAPGQEFDLMFRFGATDRECGGGDRETTGALALASLWLLCAYGGLGSRTRRGFGGLRVVSARGWLPGPWTEESIRSPALAYYQHHKTLAPGDDVIGQCMRRLIRLAQACDVPFQSAPWGDTRPTYPVLSKQHTRAGLTPTSVASWEDVLRAAGENYRHFRADTPYPEARYRPKIKTPEWADVVVPNATGTHFALGALGLPVGYRKPYVVHADRGGPTDAVTLRRASPLWLRPVGDASQWRLFSFAFQGQFLPADDVGVHVWANGRQGKAVTVADEDVPMLTDQWIKKMTAGGRFRSDTDG